MIKFEQVKTKDVVCYYKIYKNDIYIEMGHTLKDLLYYIPQKTISPELTDFLVHNGLANILNDLYNSENGNDYFDFSLTDATKISYLKGDRIPKQEYLLFDTLYREGKAYHTRIGKLLSDEMKQNNNEDIQKISALMSNRDMKNKELFLTDKICHYYHEDNYADGGGQLNSSCMKHSHLQNAIKLYENFGSDTVQLLVLTDENEMVLGRALFWHKVKCDDKNTSYLDRVYAVNDNISHLFYDYAKNKDIPYFDERKAYHLTTDVNIDDEDSVPYFDTFKYYSHGNINNSSGDYSLEGTDGNTLSEDENHTCDSCGNSFDYESEGGYSESYGGDLCDDCIVYCDDEHHHIDDCVNIDGEWYKKDDGNIVECSNGDYLHIDNACYSEYNNEYYHCDDVVYSEHHEDYFLPDDVVDVNDDYYLPDDEDIIEIDSEYHLKEDCTEIDDRWYLQDDENIEYNEETNEYKLIEDENITVKV